MGLQNNDSTQSLQKPLPTLIKGKKSCMIKKPNLSLNGGAASAAGAHPEKPSLNGFFGQSGLVSPSAAGSAPSGRGQPEATTSARIPGTSEILFLKRLLYLKAAIDNEATLPTFSVPFEQEKARDAASPDQLLLDT